ncbi:MAG: FAD-dependent oxidoreductase [Nitriliruptoraceae bacterium]
MSHVLVLGAGPAGAAAAERLSAHGHEAVVIERADRVGGAAGSTEIDGVRVDFGSHRLHRAIDPSILADLDAKLGDDLQRRPRRGRIRLAGRWLPFPLGIGAIGELPRDFAVRAAFDALTAGLRRPRADTFAEVIRAGLGPTMLERFYGPYARKLWGLDAGEIAGEQARRRVTASSPAALAARLLRGGRGERGTFLYPRRGFGQLWETLAASATAQGAHFHLGANAAAIRWSSHGVAIDLDDGTRLTGDQLWSTIPLPALVGLAEPQPPASVVAAAASLRTRAMVCVYLVLDTPRYAEADAHYFPESWTPVTRISEPKNYRDGHPGTGDDGDPTDRTVLCAEVPCNVGDPLWSLDDDALGDTVVQTLERAGLPTPSVRRVATHRLPAAYPIYDRGFAARLARVDDWASAQPRLLTFGRQGLFVHDNSHHALTMAWSAVAAIGRDGLVDADAWRAARARFTIHVVED